MYPVSSVGWLSMYWSLDKGYVVYLFSVAHVQHWNFTFSTAKQPWQLAARIRHNRSADLAFQRHYFPDSSSLGTIHF